MRGAIWKALTWADLVLIGAVVLAIIGSAAWAWKKNYDRSVFIYKNGALLGVYPLNEDRTIRIDGHNTVGIERGKVRMLAADCPGKRCVKQGAGDVLPIICLPNRVVVEIRGRDAKRPLIVR